MVRCIKVPIEEAQKAKLYLRDTKTIANEFYVEKTPTHIIFPVTKDYAGTYKVTEQDLRERNYEPPAIPFKEALATILTEEELAIAKTAYELVGDVAVMEIPDDLLHKDTQIAKALLDSNKQIKTVLRKAGGHQGTFRTQDMIIMAGEPTTVATYRENNCTITYDLNDMYFSARLSTERKRIYEQVQDGEHVLVMFSGAAPYCCVIAKNTPASHVVGVEINPSGHEFGLQNVKKNKLTNVDLYCGDVREVVPTLDEKFDRICMPLPKTAEEFLDVALSVAKKDCVIHLYGFYHEEEFDKALQEIETYCSAANRTYEILSVNKVGQQSPRTYRICVDFVVTN